MGLETVLTAPPVSIFLCPEASLLDQVAALEKAAPGRTVARIVRGYKSKTKPELMTEIGAALQFPHRFGENWDALVDATSDRSWGGVESSIVVVSRAVDLLSKEPASELKTFIEVMQTVAERLSRGGHSDKRTFKCVLHATRETSPLLENRLKEARVSLNSKAK